MRLRLGLLLASGVVVLAALQTPGEGFQKAVPTAPAQAKPPRTDYYGDPLPDGVFYRLGTTRLRHVELQQLIFSADGSQLLSQGSTNDLRVWDVATGRLVQRFENSHDYEGLVSSPDDRYLAGAWDKTACLVDKATGKQLASWVHSNGWHSLAFTTDGKTLVGLNRDRIIHRWDVTSGKETNRHPLQKQDGEVKETYARCWRLSSDGTVAISNQNWVTDNHYGERWLCWDTATGKPCRSPLLTGRLMSMFSRDHCSISSDGRLLAMVTNNSFVEVWDTVKRKNVPLEVAIKADDLVMAQVVALDPKGELLALGYAGTIEIMSLATGKQLWSKELPSRDSVGTLVFSRDSKKLGFGTAMGIIGILESTTGLPVGFSKLPSGRFQGPAYKVHFIGNGRTFVVHDAGRLSLRDTATGKALRQFAGTRVVAVSPGGASMAVLDDRPPQLKVRFFEVATGKELWHAVRDLFGIEVFATNGKVLLVSLSIVPTISPAFDQFDAKTGRVGKRLQLVQPLVNDKPADNLLAVAVSADCQRAAMLGSDGNLTTTIQIWNLGKGAKPMEGPFSTIWRLTAYFHPDDRRLIATARIDPLEKGSDSSGAEGEKTCIWDIGTGKKLHDFSEGLCHTSLDGRWLALDQGRAKGWITAIRNTDSGRLQASVPCSITFGFSPDGSMLAAAKDPHSVSVWETTTGRLLWEWRDSMWVVNGASFAPDGRTLAVTCADGTVMVCDVTGLATAPGKLPVVDLQAADTERLWNDLAKSEGPAVHKALWTLTAGGGKAVVALKERLRPVEQAETKKLAALLADLDSEKFAVRDKATQALQKLETAQAALTAALANKPTLEMRLRIELIQSKLADLPLPFDADLLRNLRAVTVLEQIGTAEARQVLTAVADGAPGMRLTEAARAALDRLAKQPR